ncbi:MAG: hypothetical protein D6722_25395 [Bacteroidetes bacterium]|nr:MAG: hypothetical protein D6722_25395 [Bacteroidota bacterium]
MGEKVVPKEQIMIEWILGGLGGGLSGALMWLGRHTFFMMARKTAALADSMLAVGRGEMSERRLWAGMGQTLLHLGTFAAVVLLAIVAGMLPAWGWGWTEGATHELPNGWAWGLGFSLCLWLLSLLRNQGPYSEWAQLLHHLVLDQPYLGRALLAHDHRFRRQPCPAPEARFLVVSGLARAGTTVLTQQLERSGPFASLSYANMPFLLAPNLWARLYRPRSGGKTERSHGDNITHDWRSVEALEEYFFKVMLRDSYIAADSLRIHPLPEDIHDQYLAYQTLVRKDAHQLYLAKNNNLILRYASLRKQNPVFRAVFLFREPLSHAASLLTQHQRFCEAQRENPFTQTYMDWLGHHEFGLNHKPFALPTASPSHQAHPAQLDYWLDVWISYYTYLLEVIDQKDLLVDYEDLALNPLATIKAIGDHWGIPLKLPKEIEPYPPIRRRTSSASEEQMQRAEALFKRLQARKAMVT